MSKAFYMGVYLVTQEQYEQIMGENPSHFKGEQNPVECVSWDDAVEFCKKLSRKTGKTVTLPTERTGNTPAAGARRDFVSEMPTTSWAITPGTP